MKPLWILDSYLLERSTPESGPTFSDALVSAGCDVTVHSFDPRAGKSSPPAPLAVDRPALAYGSFAFVRNMLRDQKLLPGSYARIENLSFQKFAAYAGDLLLNDDFHMLPFGEVLRRPPPDRDVFIRPDRVTKSFTGFTATPDRYSYEVGCLETVSRVSRDEIVIIASAKPIELECRYVIADGTVVAGSTYSWEEGATHTANTDPRCDAVAKEMARRDWQPDTVYTCDVALSDGRARIVELNSFSCAGLYACDTVAVAEAVTACMLDEFGMA